MSTENRNIKKNHISNQYLVEKKKKLPEELIACATGVKDIPNID